MKWIFILVLLTQISSSLSAECVDVENFCVILIVQNGFCANAVFASQCQKSCDKCPLPSSSSTSMVTLPSSSSAMEQAMSPSSMVTSPIFSSAMEQAMSSSSMVTSPIFSTAMEQAMSSSSMVTSPIFSSAMEQAMSSSSMVTSPIFSSAMVQAMSSSSMVTLPLLSSSMVEAISPTPSSAIPIASSIITTTEKPVATVPPPSSNDLSYCKLESQICSVDLRDFQQDNGDCFDESESCDVYTPRYCDAPFVKRRCQRSCELCTPPKGYSIQPNGESKEICPKECQKFSCFQSTLSTIRLSVTQTDVKEKSGCACQNREANICDTAKFCMFLTFRRRKNPSTSTVSRRTSVEVCLRHCRPNDDCDCVYQQLGCQQLTDTNEFDVFKTKYFQFNGQCKGVNAYIKIQKGDDIFDVTAFGLRTNECPSS